VIVRFADGQGRPVVGATVCVSASPEPHPDLAMLTDSKGEIDLDLTAAGTYGFVLYRNGQAIQVTTHIRSPDQLVALRID
jgi:hypothetical protein